MDIRAGSIWSIALAAVLVTACAPQRVKIGGNDYRVVVKDGEEYFCHDEPVTGSRVSTREVCRTRRQIDEAQQEVRRMQTPPTDIDLPDTQPGAY
ncbi:MAG: hypothetical protein DIU62_006095 [Pseudomonadota bacterium]|jgi:hypothetical protein